METKINNFNTLEAMRGVAALMVVFFHMNSHWPGHLAVDFFLVLSGFILTHSYQNAKTDISKKDFILKRIIRLYPLHIFALLIYTGFYITFKSQWPTTEEGFISTLAQQLTLTNNLGLTPKYGLTLWNYPSWSISVEFWINVLFVLVITRKTNMWIMACMAITCLGTILMNSNHLNVHHANYYTFVNAGLLRGIASFLLGIIAYRLYLKYQDTSHHTHIRKYAGSYETLLVILLASVLLIRSEVKDPVDFLAPPLFLLMVILFACEGGYISRGLKEIRYLGTISYSIYLNQITILMICGYIFETYSINQEYMMIAVILSLLTYSHFTYRYIELTSKNYLQRKFLNRTQK